MERRILALSTCFGMLLTKILFHGIIRYRFGNFLFNPKRTRNTFSLWPYAAFLIFCLTNPIYSAKASFMHNILIFNIFILIFAFIWVNVTHYYPGDSLCSMHALPKNHMTFTNRAIRLRHLTSNACKIILKTWRWPGMIATKVSMDFSDLMSVT